MSMFFNILSMGGVTYDADYQAYLDYLTTNSLAHPSTAKKTVENAFMIAVKSAFSQSTISACPILQMLMFKTDAASGASLVNWHNPGTYTATAVNSPTFTSDLGWNSNGTTSYITGGVTNASITQTNFTILVRAHTDGQNNGVITGFGDRDVNTQAENFNITPRNTSDVLTFQAISSSGTNITVANTNGLARIAIGRTDGSNVHSSLNGAAFTSTVNSVNAQEISRDMVLLAYNGLSGIVSYFTNGVSYRIITTRKLTDAEVAAVDAALVNYLA